MATGVSSFGQSFLASLIFETTSLDESVINFIGTQCLPKGDTKNRCVSRRFATCTRGHVGSDKIHGQMPKNARLSFRVRSDLKKALEAIATKEARSVAQICEAILLEGATTYHREGTKYLNRLISPAAHTRDR